MPKVNVVLNRDEVSRQILKSAEMQDILSELGSQIASRAGDGYEARVKLGKRRAYVDIVAATYRARASNLKHNTLVKALGGKVR